MVPMLAPTEVKITNPDTMEYMNKDYCGMMLAILGVLALLFTIVRAILENPKRTVDVEGQRYEAVSAREEATEQSDEAIEPRDEVTEQAAKSITKHKDEDTGTQSGAAIPERQPRPYSLQ